VRLEATDASATPFPVWALAAPESPMDLGIEGDAENRLLAVKQSGSPLATFTYDGSGRRATTSLAALE